MSSYLLTFTYYLLGCHRFGMKGLGTRLSTCCPIKRSKWRCSQHASADQTSIPCVPVASPQWMVCTRRAHAPALSPWASSTWRELQSLLMQRRRDGGPRCATHPRNIINESWHDEIPHRLKLDMMFISPFTLTITPRGA